MACSSRNPQNCLAGANDYRTVDIPFPDDRREDHRRRLARLVHDQERRPHLAHAAASRLSAGRSAAGLASPLQGYPAGADPIIRSGTNGLFYYGGLVVQPRRGRAAAPSSSRASSTTTTRKGAPANRSPISARRSSTESARRRSWRAGRVVASVPRLAWRSRERERERERAPSGRNARARQVPRRRRAAGGAEQMVDKPWMAVDIPRAGASKCSIGGPGTGIPLQTFPGGRVYMAYALFDGPGEERGRIMFSYSANCGVTWSPPRMISRVQSADVNDDGVATTADVTRLQASFGSSCGRPASIRTPTQQRLQGQRSRSDLRRARRRPASPHATPTLTGRHARHRPADGDAPDRLASVQRRRPSRRHRHGSLDQRRRELRRPPVVVHARPVRAGHDRHLVPHQRLPDAWRSTAPAARTWRGPRAGTPSSVQTRRSAMPASSSRRPPTAPPGRRRRPIDNQESPGHQIMPALTFAQGKLQLVYYDLREDRLAALRAVRRRVADSDGSHRRACATRSTSGPRKPIRARARRSPPSGSRSTASGAVPGAQTIQQLEFSPPNLPIFRAGTVAVHGRLPRRRRRKSPFVRNGSTWSFNTAAAASRGVPRRSGRTTATSDRRPTETGPTTPRPIHRSRVRR